MTATSSAGAQKISSESGVTAKSVNIGPNEQGVFLMDYDPRTVNVDSNSNFDGSFYYVWLYAAATAVTPTLQQLASEANVTLRPPAPDSNGNIVRTLVIWNTSGIQITATERST